MTYLTSYEMQMAKSTGMGKYGECDVHLWWLVYLYLAFIQLYILAYIFDIGESILAPRLWL